MSDPCLTPLVLMTKLVTAMRKFMFQKVETEGGPHTDAAGAGYDTGADGKGEGTISPTVGKGRVGKNGKRQGYPVNPADCSIQGPQSTPRKTSPCRMRRRN